MSEFYRLVYGMSDGKAKQIRVTNPHVSLTPTEIRNAMINIVDSAAYAQNGVQPTQLKKAQHIEITRIKHF